MATRKTTPSRSTTRKTAAKPAPKLKTSAAPKPVVETETAEAAPAVPERQALRKKDLFERVKARADGVKGREVRVVLEAVLEELGGLLISGEALNVPPLGNIKVQRRRDQGGADVVVFKLRRKKPGQGGKDPLAEAAE